MVHNGLKVEMKQCCQVDLVTARTEFGFFHQNNLTALDFEHPLSANSTSSKNHQIRHPLFRGLSGLVFNKSINLGDKYNYAAKWKIPCVHSDWSSA